MNGWEALFGVFALCVVYAITSEIVKAVKEVKLKKYECKGK